MSKNKNNIVQYITNERRKNYNNKKKNIFVEILWEYFSNSTLHGITYLGDKDKNLIEKIWWIIMFILSVTTCSFLISETWTKWKENPVILSFENEQVPIWDIPFPAVTVCPLNKINQLKYNYTYDFRNRRNLEDKDYKLFWDISLMCNLEFYDPFETYECSVNITDNSAVTNIRKYGHTLNETFASIVWQNQEIPVTNFAEQITEEGLCFTFNTLNQKDMYTDQLDHDVEYIHLDLRNKGWTLQDGYSQTTKINSHPRRTAKDGRAYGLSFSLTSYPFLNDYICGLPISGFKIIIHSPAENPNTSQKYFLIPPNRKFAMIVTPEFISTSRSLEDLPPHTRKCYFSNEKYLMFYKFYTQNNCRTECIANITRQYCGCIPFYMSRDKNTGICGYGSKDCVEHVKKEVLKLEALKMSETPEEDQERLQQAYEIFKQCDCLPSCTSLEYSAETTQTERRLMRTNYSDSTSLAQRKQNSKGNTTTIQVDIFFKTSQFFALHRSELYGQTDFLANCGGLLGLFMGFSLLSLMEVIYFFTIRLWFKYKSRQ